MRTLSWPQNLGVQVQRFTEEQGKLLAIALAIIVAGYIGWKISESPVQALQFAFNGLSVGAVYALLAMGFTLVYSTVWFFDLYYGGAAALGAYGVFYLRSGEALGGLYQVNEPIVNILFGAVVAGVIAWALREGLYNRLRVRFRPLTLRMTGGLLAVGTGVYLGLVLTFADNLNIMLSPAIGILSAVVLGWLMFRGYRHIWPKGGLGAFFAVALIPAGVTGMACALLVFQSSGSSLYLSWGVSCLFAGALGLALYRGLYLYMLKRARSPLIMLVASLGILLAITAFTTIIFQSAPRPLPDAFGSDPWTIGGANIKGFSVFTIGMAFVGFALLIVLLRRTSFGKAVRAIGDDEEISKVVGINTTVIISIVFFIGAAYAALAGLLSGHDTAIQPRMGLLLLLKGWIASVAGGIGNLYGAIVGGFALGVVEQFGIWDLAGEWKDVIAFVVLIMFLSFWPKGLIPRK